jgi:hypothetical protein
VKILERKKEKKEFEAIFENSLTCVSETQGKLFDEKKTEVENLMSGSL